MNSQEISKLVSKELEKSWVNAIYNFSNRTPHIRRLVDNLLSTEVDFNSIIVSNFWLITNKNIVLNDDPNEITSYTYLTKLYELTTKS